LIGIALNIVQSTTNESFDIQSLSNWATVIGFVFSIATLIWTATVNNRVTRLKRFYAFHLAIDGHIKAISSQLSNLKSLLRTPESNKMEICETLTIISEQNKSLQSKLNRSERSSLKRLNYFIRNKLNKEIVIQKKRKWLSRNLNFWFPSYFKYTPEDCWSIYQYSHGILNRLINLKHDHDLKIQ
jgi:hypothetical protein